MDTIDNLDTIVYCFTKHGGDSYTIVKLAAPADCKYLFKHNGTTVGEFDENPTMDCFFKHIQTHQGKG